MTTLLPLALICCAIGAGFTSVKNLSGLSNENVYFLNIIIAQFALLSWALAFRAYFGKKNKNQIRVYEAKVAVDMSNFALPLLAVYLLTLLTVAGVFAVRTATSLVAVAPSSAAIRDFARVVNDAWSINFIVITCVVAPLVEEFVFRKSLFDFSHGEIGVAVTACMSTALFAVGHSHSLFWVGLVVGSAASVLYVKTSSLTLCVIFHGTLNFVHSFVFSRVQTWDTVAELTQNFSDIRALVIGTCVVIVFWISALIWLLKVPRTPPKPLPP